MQEPTQYAVPFPAQPSPVSEQGRGWRLILIVVLIAALVVAGMSWLQWAAQRGLTLGYPQPSVHFNTSPPGTLQLNQSYAFSANASGRDLTYIWSFGDQQNSFIGSSVDHTYSANGTYTVSVTVTDPLGHSSTASQQVSVLPPPPQAAFTFSVGYYGNVSFDASTSSVDASTSIASYQWEFGDGGTDNTSYPTDYHTYGNYGSYTVTLIVTDATGQQSASVQATVVI